MKTKNRFLFVLTFILLLVSCIPDTPTYNVPSLQVKATNTSLSLQVSPKIGFKVQLYKYVQLNPSDPNSGFTKQLQPEKYTNQNGVVLYDSLDFGYYQIKVPIEAGGQLTYCWLENEYDTLPFLINKVKRYYKRKNYNCSGI